jgi:hypothetical protein
VRSNHPDAAARIEQWAHQNDIGTVIWTTIGPRFKEKTGVPFSAEAAICYLASLPEAVRVIALQYIHNAPADVVTPVRTRVESVFPASALAGAMKA